MRTSVMWFLAVTTVLDRVRGSRHKGSTLPRYWGGIGFPRCRALECHIGSLLTPKYRPTQYLFDVNINPNTVINKLVAKIEFLFNRGSSDRL